MLLVQTSQHIPVTDIAISPYHFRKETADHGLDALVKSMDDVGQIHNIAVVRSPDGSYQLTNGHRRLRAADRAGMATVRADVYEFTPEELVDEQQQQKAISKFLLAANQAEPLIPIERARFYRDVMDKFGWDVDAIAAFYGVAKADIIHDLKFLNITPKVFDIVAMNPQKVAGEHLELLAEYASPDKKGWRITETEQVALAQSLVSQQDKLAAEEPKEFEKTIRQLRAEERKKAQEKKAVPPRAPIQLLKDIVRALESVESSCKMLARIDLPTGTSIELVDKREIIDRCYELAEILTRFADSKIGPLQLKKTPVEV